MYREEDIPKRLRFAIIMLVALLIVSMQQQVIRSFFSDPVNTAVEAEKQLILKQGSDTVHAQGILHDDSQLTFATLVAFTFFLTLFPVIQERKVLTPTPVTLSRNFCCIVPKGP